MTNIAGSLNLLLLNHHLFSHWKLEYKHGNPGCFSRHLSKCKTPTSIFRLLDGLQRTACALQNRPPTVSVKPARHLCSLYKSCRQSYSPIKTCIYQLSDINFKLEHKNDQSGDFSEELFFACAKNDLCDPSLAPLSKMISPCRLIFF